MQTDFEALLRSGIAYKSGGRTQRAITALSAAATADAPTECATQAHSHLSVIYRSQGNWDRALHHARRSAEAAAQTGSIALQCEALNAEGGIYLQRRELDAAEQIFRRILDLATDEQMKARGLALANIGVVSAERGDLSVAHKLFQASHDACQIAGYTPGVVVALNNLGRVSLDAGDVDAALAYFAQSKRAAQAIGDLELLGLASMNKAEALAKGGKPEAAERLIEQAIGEFTAGDNHFRRCYSLSVLAMIAEVLGHNDEAVRCYQQAMAASRSHGFAHLEERFAARLGALAVDADEPA